MLILHIVIKQNILQISLNNKGNKNVLLKYEKLKELHHF